MDSEQAFEDAQRRVHDLAERPGDDDLLALYGLFKQATVGDATGKRPGMLDFKGRAKFDAWKARAGMRTDEARQAYVDLVERLDR